MTSWRCARRCVADIVLGDILNTEFGDMLQITVCFLTCCSCHVWLRLGYVFGEKLQTVCLVTSLILCLVTRCRNCDQWCVTDNVLGDVLHFSDTVIGEILRILCLVMCWKYYTCWCVAAIVLKIQFTCSKWKNITVLIEIFNKYFLMRNWRFLIFVKNKFSPKIT